MCNCFTNSNNYKYFRSHSDSVSVLRSAEHCGRRVQLSTLLNSNDYLLVGKSFCIITRSEERAFFVFLKEMHVPMYHKSSVFRFQAY